jgi:hypothetical protein
VTLGGGIKTGTVPRARGCRLSCKRRHFSYQGIHDGLSWIFHDKYRGCTADIVSAIEDLYRRGERRIRAYRVYLAFVCCYELWGERVVLPNNSRAPFLSASALR